MTTTDLRKPWFPVPDVDCYWQRRTDGNITVRQYGAMGEAWYGEGATIVDALDDLAVNFRGSFATDG